ncbi:MAG: hypothetical protein V1734_04675 [Nanoarchaeota archaeon]
MKISLEQQVINALVRRKADYISRAIDSPEYRKAADRAKAEVAGYSVLARDPEVAEAASGLCEIINSANSDESSREEFATTLAYYICNNAQDIERKSADMLGYSGSFEKSERENVYRRVSDWKRLMQRQYGLVLNIIENAMQFGAETALTKEGINDAIKTRYHSAGEYLALESEIQEAVESFSHLNSEFAMQIQMEAKKEMAELYGEKAENLDSIFYISLIAEKAVGLTKLLCLKAAELEANEVFAEQ